MDKYLVELDKITTDVEKLCGLGIKSGDGIPYVDKSIIEITEFCISEADKLPSESIKALNASVGKKMVLLSYVAARLKYFNKKKVDFSMIPCMPDIANVLIQFTKKGNIDDDALVQLDKCIIILSDVEKKSPAVRKMISFRLLRLFVILIAYSFMCSASIVADLLLLQVIVKEGDV